VFLPNDRKRFAPITLPAEQPIPELIIYRFLPQALGFQPGSDLSFGFRRGQAIERNLRIGRIYRNAIIDVSLPILARGRLYDLKDLEIEFRRKFEIPCVMSRDGHNRTSAITDEHIIGYPNRDFLSADRVERVSACENAGLVFGQFGTLEI